MLDARFRPLERWVGARTKGRRNATFRAKYTQTLDLLESELNHLRAKNITIEAGFRLDQIRNDGWPRSSAGKPSEPGVILSFTAKGGNVAMPCDTFSDWEDNLRAIALSLEALRAVDRYGVTKSGEQYRGFAQLPAPGSTEPSMDVQSAATMLATFSTKHSWSELLRDERAYREALANAHRATHPDLSKSDNTTGFLRVQEAKRVLDVHFGGGVTKREAVTDGK